MLTRIDYISHRGGAWIYRVYGIGDSVTIPETVDSLPVTGLTDHTFAAEPSFRYHAREIKSFYPEEDFRLEGDVLHTNAVTEIHLPSSLQDIGNYCFYGCRNLKKLSVHGKHTRLGGGVFTGCTGLESLTVRSFDENSLILKNILAEIIYQLDVWIEPVDGAPYGLVYPGYYEESVENTPARNIDMAFHGPGYRYRSEFKKAIPDFPVYDELYYYTTVSENESTYTRLAFFRIRYPKELSEAHKEVYNASLKENASVLFPILLQRNDPEDLDCLAKEGFFTDDILESYLALARENQNLPLMVYFNNLRMKTASSSHKTYDL